MLVTGKTWRADIPHEPGEWMEFRKLSWVELEKAAKTRRQKLLSELTDISGILDKLPQPEKGTQTQQDQYDTAELLKAAIVAWSYSGPVTPENLNLLDAATAEWAVGEIVKAHTAKTEDERKNG